MALRKRGAKPDPDEEEDLDEGAEEGDSEGDLEDDGAADEESEGEEGDAAEEAEEADEEEEAEEGEAAEEDGDEEEADEDEEEVTTRSRRGPAAKGTIEDKPVLDGYTWMAVITCCLFITAMVVQIREHSVYWRMGVTMSTDPVRSTTHFNTVSEIDSEAGKAPKFGEAYNSKTDRFGQDAMEYQEVTQADVDAYPILKTRVMDANSRGTRPLPVFKDELPNEVERLVPLYGLSALKWDLTHKAGAVDAGLDAGMPPVDAGTPPVDGAVPPPVDGAVPPPADGAVPPPPPPVN